MSSKKSTADNSGGNSGQKNVLPFRWPKGVSGNPGGRPRKKPITEYYAAFAGVQVSELPARIRKKFKDCDDLNLVAASALGLFVAMGEASHSAAKELREGIEGKLTEKIDLTIDVNRDVVERLKAARDRLAKCASSAETAGDASGANRPSRTG